MKLNISDPLELLPYLTGAVPQPLKEGAAKGSSDLNANQTAVVIGEPIPILFCRRVSNNGGVWVSPGATEGRFQNNGNNNLIASYHLVLSEGRVPQIPLADLYQGECAIGTWVQTYNRRAGSWTLGNYITSLNYADVQFQHSTQPGIWQNATFNNTYKYWEYIMAGSRYYFTTGVTAIRNTTGADFKVWKCPTYCGTSGTYANLTTISYTSEYDETDDSWTRQLHCFVRNGMEVTRILDSVVGSSNNFVDLALYLIKQTSRFPDYLIDTTAMTLAANYTNTNSFFYNGLFSQSGNLEDWLQTTAPQFLLRLSDKYGKKGFRPLLPINNDYTIKTTAISWVFGFTEEHILPDGFEIEYITLSERKPICALVMWRQQPENNIGIIRTTEVRFAGEAVNGPFEQYDLSEFCTVENHAVKVGTYYIARRKYITHSLRIRVRPDAYNATLLLGDIVRVKLRRETNAGDVTYHDYLYEVERISKNISGVVELDLMHFPVDSQNRSLVAVAVAAAAGAGYSLPSGRVDFSCSLNISTTPISDVGGNIGGLPASSNFQYDATEDTEGPIIGGISNPTDLGGSLNQNLGDFLDTGTVSLSAPCPGGVMNWYRIPKNASTWDAAQGIILDYTAKQFISQSTNAYAGASLVLTTSDIDYIIYAEALCPDPSTPSGFGVPIPMGNTNPVTPDITAHQWVRWKGALRNTNGVVTQAQSPFYRKGVNYDDYMTIGPVFGCGMFGSTPLASDSSTSCPPIGPVPWRASVTTTNKGVVNPTGNWSIGGLGNDGNGPSCITSTYFMSIAWGGTVPGRTISVIGVWQFSDNGSTVVATWQGDTESSEGT